MFLFSSLHAKSFNFGPHSLDFSCDISLGEHLVSFVQAWFFRKNEELFTFFVEIESGLTLLTIFHKIVKSVLDCFNFHTCSLKIDSDRLCSSLKLEVCWLHLLRNYGKRFQNRYNQNTSSFRLE